MLTIETSTHNETRLARALATQLGWGVYALGIQEHGNEYIIQWKSENSTLWMLYLSRVSDKKMGRMQGEDYYKLKCDKAVWYLRRDEIEVLDTFVFNIAGVIDLFIKMSK